MRKSEILLCIVLAVFVFSQSNCPGNNGEENNPLPVLTSISPTAKAANLPAFTLAATGTDFVSGAKIVFNGSEKATTFVSATELTCQVEPADIPASSAAAQNQEDLSGTLSTTVPVLVRNPAPGGGDSGSLNFTILDDPAFQSPVTISANTGRYLSPRIALDNTGNVYVAWYDAPAVGNDIFFVRSADNGATWGTPVNLSVNTTSSRNPDIAVDGSGNICVVWRDQDAMLKDQIYFIRSTDNGSTWTTPVNISDTQGSSAGAYIAVDSSGNIGVTWTDNTTGDNKVVFSKSTNDGATWSTPAAVSEDSKDRGASDIAVAGSGDIYVFWDYLSQNPLPDPNEIEIFCSRSTDNGASWGTVLNASNNAGESYDPKIVLDASGNINLAWYDDTLGNDKILFSRSTDNGISWSTAVNVSAQVLSSLWPAIGMDSAGNIDVVWVQKRRGDDEIYFSRSIDTGASWCNFVNVSDTTGESSSPDIAVDSAGNIHVVWREYTTGPIKMLIYYTNSIDGF